MAYRLANRQAEPDWWNGPAPSFGSPAARLLVLGLAPGRGGANRTGRVFTGDHAGHLLYATLLKFGFAAGVYRADPADGLTLCETMITNAVGCAPPANKPTLPEIRSCGVFLKRRIAALGNLRVIITLGGVAHEACLRALDLRPRDAPFVHGACADLRVGERRVRLIASYHCSRYNTNTNKLTDSMFEAVFAAARQCLDEDDGAARP